MLSEICLGIIAVALIMLIAVLVRVFFQIKQSASVIQRDLQNLSTEALSLLNNINEFVQSDLQIVTHETRHLISNLNTTTSSINDKISSFDFFFKPLSALNSKLTTDSTHESEPQPEPIPGAIKWIASSAYLFKTIKELIKNHGK